MLDVFKPVKKGDDRQRAYLYTNGTLVVLFKRRTDVGTIRYAKMHIKATRFVRWSSPVDSYHLNSSHDSTLGRIVFHSPALLAAMLSLPNPRINVYLDNSSENSKRLNFHIDSVGCQSDLGYFSVNQIDRLISSGVTIQPDFTPTDETKDRWGDYQIIKKYGLPKEEAAPATVEVMAIA